jgi:hypothetical protein
MPDLREQGLEVAAHLGRPRRQLVAEHVGGAGQVPEHVAQLPEVATLADDLEAAADQAREPLLGGPAFRAGPEGFRDVARPLEEDDSQQVVLVAEVVVQESLGDAGLLRDVAHGGALEAQAREGRARGGEEAAPAVGAELLVLPGSSWHRRFG